MNFLYLGTSRDLKYSHMLKGCVGPNHKIITKGSSTNYMTDVTRAVVEVQHKYNTHVHGIICSDPVMLNRYLKVAYGRSVAEKDPATLHKYQGAMFEHKVTLTSGTEYNLPVVIITSPEHLAYDRSKKFLTAMYISKLWNPEYFTAPKLLWSVGDEETLPEIYKMFSAPNCILCAIDIETRNAEVDPRLTSDAFIEDVPIKGMTFIGHGRSATGKAARLANLFPHITMVGYTGIFRTDTGALHSYTVVIPMTSPKLYAWIQKFNLIDAPKVFHNGLYDNAWLLRFNAPVNNWAFDTYGLMHSWYVELPRSLAATSALVLRNHMYWKDESESNMKEYCAKDCHATAWSCIAMIQQMPDWAKKNFLITFKKVFPALTCNLEGWAENEERSRELWQKYKDKIVEDQLWWDRAVVPNFNTGSPPQVKKLMANILGMPLKSTDKKSLEGQLHKHPMWRMFIEKLFETRHSKKADSTYMNIELFCGRVLYGIDPFGTDTSRSACKASPFWCGTQIQNIPVYAKYKFEFDQGWNGVAIDNEQSESRTTAYITGDEALIDAVENSKDFHTRNASRFFGIPEEELWEMKTSNPDLYKKYRNKIGKRVNHGANYNMMENTLIATMTPLGIIEAKAALKLPAKWTFKQVASYLLQCFDQAYPKIRSKEPGGYHRYIIDTVRNEHKLTTPNGWTRYTFLNPGPEPENKLDLNALVAHLPQGWSVQLIDKAFFKVWHELQITRNMIRVKAQVHDEIIYQVRPEHEAESIAYASKVMAEPQEVNGRIMVIPNAPKGNARFWNDLKD